MILFVVAFRGSVIGGRRAGGFWGPEASFFPSESSELVNRFLKLLFSFSLSLFVLFFSFLKVEMHAVS